MEEIISSMPYWYWIAFGAALLILEVFIPSTLLLWPGIAAIFVGLVSAVFPAASDPVLLLVWGVSSLILVVAWLAYRKKNKKDRPTSTINRRGDQLVDRHFTLTKDIVNGHGELHIDDTRWKIVSDIDHSAGAKVKVTSVEGTSLKVEEYIS
jgi:membrane protein implicated in regulation of membrane protease activity